MKVRPKDLAAWIAFANSLMDLNLRGRSWSENTKSSKAKGKAKFPILKDGKNKDKSTKKCEGTALEIQQG